ncbi:MAG: acetate--CoA ligase family protein [Rhodospirillaceae bacterium]|nr:acetate--CoA ligase family protein [Rhodospirillaceae bacterium]MBT5456263.1 acetate--CoA ligase family protein [Rhodospirillaceae bacterium]
MARSAADIFNARNVAIVGATDKSHWPRNIYANLVESGFPADKVFPINPKRSEIFGVTCYPDLASLPESPDLALMIIPAPAIEGALRQGVAHGLKAAVVYAAGFGDGGREESLQRGEAFRKTLDELDISVCGPNCMGLAGIRQKLYCYPHEHVRQMEPGPVALVTQSGGTLSYFTRCAQERGLRFSYAISSGNELSLDLSDYMNFVIDDPETKQICLFIEGIRKPDAFKQAAAKALAAGKPLIAIKTGRSQKSREAAQSHSGAVSGDYAAYEAVCERYGIINCDSLEEMIEMTLGFQQGRLPKGPAIAFMTTSGGTVDLLHDYCEQEGAVVPDLAPKTVEAIRPYVPADCHIRNPIDTGAPVGVSGKSSPVEICKLFAADPGVDMVAWCNNMPGSARSTGVGDEVTELVQATDKPVISFARMPHQIPEGGLAFQDETGMPFVQGTRTGVRVMNALWFYAQRTGRVVGDLPAPNGYQEDCAGEALEKTLASAGIPAPKTARAKNAAEAGDAAASVGFPTALKIVSPEASHKTEVGGVSLNIADEQGAIAAAEAMEARLKAHDSSARVDGFLAQEMVSGTEMLIGARDDALYGPLIILGAGGVMVELMRDVAVRLLPVNEDDVRDMLASLKSAALLDGYRGAPAADKEALIAAVVALGNFYLDHRHLLADVEINPLMVRPGGEGVCAVDIRAIAREN